MFSKKEINTIEYLSRIFLIIFGIMTLMALWNMAYVAMIPVHLIGEKNVISLGLSLVSLLAMRDLAAKMTRYFISCSDKMRKSIIEHYGIDIDDQRRND